LRRVSALVFTQSGNLTRRYLKKLKWLYLYYCGFCKIIVIRLPLPIGQGRQFAIGSLGLL
jgi:hypothetical protein